MCGEHCDSICRASPRLGSSPRVRGTHRKGGGVSTGAGIIPACAGNTCRSGGSSSTGRDHPRVRGEHESGIWTRRSGMGSSPRARGTLHLSFGFWCSGGIIPACAGNTCFLQSDNGFRRDHPRVRGEHDGITVGTPVQLGSSPRARGTRHRKAHRQGQDGIIPACAGNTWSADFWSWCGGDHPRVRGEHMQVNAASIAARGTQDVGHGDVYLLGIIPACAGNTSRVSRGVRFAQDHPRVRGEHDEPAAIQPILLGSSPRARGTHGVSVGCVRRPGIIPACAGNTGESRPHPPPDRDHPRVRGEHQSTKPPESPQ